MEEKIENTATTEKVERPVRTGSDRPATQARRPYTGSGNTGSRSGSGRPDRYSKGSDGRKKFGGKKNFIFKKRVCFFCKNKDAVVDYKDVGLMKRFVAESGKISPRRFTGTCAKHQKKLTVEIKKARQMALLIFTDKHK